MREVVKITSVLTTVCLVCAFLLSFVWGLSHKKIAFNAERRVEEALSILAPQAAEIREAHIDEELIYKLFDQNESLIAYAFIASGQGYQGKIKMLVVAEASLNRLVGIEVVESLETPGLGAKIQEDFFKQQFANLSLKGEIVCRKGVLDGPGQIKAITGATVSSQAVVNILNQRLKQIREVIKAERKLE